MKLYTLKRSLAVTMAAMLLILCIPGIFAEVDVTTVYVTVADADGALVLAREPVSVADTDADGVLSVADALYAAHEAAYNGGAAAGFACSLGEYGLKIDKLWGVENGGSYGYAVNHASAANLAAPVQDGDTVAAFVYTDLAAWSDTYCYFDKDTVSAEAGGSVTLTLSANGYDQDWTPVVIPVADAAITLNGEATEYITDAAGTVTVTFDKAGEIVVSAVADDAVLVPPVCVAAVAGESPVLLFFGIGAILLIAAAGIFVILRKKKR